MKPITILMVLVLMGTALTGCKEKEDIEVLWDEWGVPQIYTGSDARLAYGLGWAQMHIHGNLTLKLYGIFSGQAADAKSVHS